VGAGGRLVVGGTTVVAEAGGRLAGFGEMAEDEGERRGGRERRGRKGKATEVSEPSYVLATREEQEGGPKARTKCFRTNEAEGSDREKKMSQVVPSFRKWQKPTVFLSRKRTRTLKQPVQRNNSNISNQAHMPSRLRRGRWEAYLAWSKTCWKRFRKERVGAV
jgi:hypothetical protein